MKGFSVCCGVIFTGVEEGPLKTGEGTNTWGERMSDFETEASLLGGASNTVPGTGRRGVATMTTKDPSATLKTEG